jgi:hypothetical protein
MLMLGVVVIAVVVVVLVLVLVAVVVIILEVSRRISLRNEGERSDEAPLQGKWALIYIFDHSCVCL